MHHWSPITEKCQRKIIGNAIWLWDLIKYGKYALWEKLFCSFCQVFLYKDILVAPWWEFFYESFSSFPWIEPILRKILLKWHKGRFRNQMGGWLLRRISIKIPAMSESEHRSTKISQPVTWIRFSIHSLLIWSTSKLCSCSLLHERLKSH